MALSSLLRKSSSHMKRKVICYQLGLGKLTCWRFDWMLQLSFRVKVKEVRHWRSTQRLVRIAPPSLPPAVVQQPGTSSTPSWLKRSFEGVIWMCKHQQLLSSTMSQHCGLLLVSQARLSARRVWLMRLVSSQWIGLWFFHVCSATADISIIPLSQHLSVPSVSSPVSVWSPQCRCGHSCRGYNIPHWNWIAYQEVVYRSLTLVNIEQRVHPDLLNP